MATLSQVIVAAAAKGDERRVIQLIGELRQQGTDIDAAPNGQTALCAAAFAGHAGICRILISNGADVNRKGKKGECVLHLAAHRGHGDVVRTLCVMGADIGALDARGWSAMHYAAFAGQADSLRILLREGSISADPNAGPGVESPLSLAALGRKAAAARLLLQAGASRSRVSDPSDRKYLQALVQESLNSQHELHSRAPRQPGVLGSRSAGGAAPAPAPADTGALAPAAHPSPPEHHIPPRALTSGGSVSSIASSCHSSVAYGRSGVLQIQDGPLRRSSHAGIMNEVLAPGAPPSPSSSGKPHSASRPRTAMRQPTAPPASTAVVKELKAELDAVKVSTAQLAGQVASHNALIASLSASSAQEVLALASRLNTAQASADQATARAQELERLLAAAKADKQRSSEAVQQAQLAAERSSNSVVETTKLRAVQVEAEAAAHRAAALERELVGAQKDKEAAVAELQRQVQQLQGELSQLKASSQQLEGTVASREQQVEELQQQVNELQNALTAAAVATQEAQAAAAKSAEEAKAAAVQASGKASKAEGGAGGKAAAVAEEGKGGAGHKAAWELGVNLSWLKEFAAGVPEDWSTELVAERLIKPATSIARCSFADLLLHQQQAHAGRASSGGAGPLAAAAVGPAMYHVSHRWGCNFRAEVVQPLLSHFDAGLIGDGHPVTTLTSGLGKAATPAAAVYVYLDLFSASHHHDACGEGMAHGEQDPTEPVRGVIEHATATILLLDPFTLTRLWCLYEIWQSAETKSASGLVILPTGPPAPSLSLDPLRKTFAELDVEVADVCSEAPRKAILTQAAHGPGFERVNKLIRSALVDSALHEVARVEEEVVKDEQRRAVEAAASGGSPPASDAHGRAVSERLNMRLAAAYHMAGRLQWFSGRMEEAEVLLRKAADASMSEPCESDGGEAAVHSLNALAALMKEQARLQDAEPLYQQALGVKEKVLGPDHPDVAAALNNLALLQQAQSKLSDAEPLHRRALAIRESALGPDHPDLAVSINNLASLLDAQGKLAEAAPLFQRALELREKVLGPDHPDSAASLNNLASLLHNQGKLGEAEPLYRRALAIWESSLGPDHPHVAQSLNNLAWLLHAQNKLEDAMPLYRRALDIREKALGTHHPDVAQSLNNYASLLYNQGRLAEAEPLLRRALEIWEKSLGPNHPDVAASLNNVAQLLKAQGKLEEAEPLFRQALGIKEKALGPDHPDVATSLNNLASLMDAQDALAAAEPLYRRALAIREKSLGLEHPDVAASLNNLASLLQAQGQLQEAQPLYRRALDIWLATLGPDHPHVAQSQTNLMWLLQAMQDPSSVMLPAGGGQDSIGLAPSFNTPANAPAGGVDRFGEIEPQ